MHANISLTMQFPSSCAWWKRWLLSTIISRTKFPCGQKGLIPRKSSLRIKWCGLTTLERGTHTWTSTRVIGRPCCLGGQAYKWPFWKKDLKRYPLELRTFFPSMRPHGRWSCRYMLEWCVYMTSVKGLQFSWLLEPGLRRRDECHVLMRTNVHGTDANIYRVE